jgi:hypothetical protein
MTSASLASAVRPSASGRRTMDAYSFDPMISLPSEWKPYGKNSELLSRLDLNPDPPSVRAAEPARMTNQVPI